MTNEKNEHHQTTLQRDGYRKGFINIKLRDCREHVIDISHIEKISNTIEPDNTILRISGDWTCLEINYHSFIDLYYAVLAEVSKSDTALNVFIMDFSQSVVGSVRRDERF